MKLSRQQLIDGYQHACEIELQAFKPGNVSIYSDGHEMTVADFRLSYQVSSKPITEPTLCLGEKIYYAVKATKEAVACNTNLGIILLCAPLLQAAAQWQTGANWRDAVQQLLRQTTQHDADWAFKAIALAAPGGLGQSAQQDVRQPATMTLTAAMELAAGKDRIARQYITDYKDVFEFTIFEYNRAFNWFGDFAWAAVAVYAALLSKFPDSHIERKYGAIHTEWVKAKGTTLYRDLSSTRQAKQLLHTLYDVDKAFKAKGINPGTSADLTVATVLVAYLERLMKG